MRWGGSLSLFAVPRERVAEKLRQINSRYPCAHGLTLPNKPVLTEFLQEDQHVVGVAIGNLESTSFIDTLPARVSDQFTLRTPSVQFFIPMLTGQDPNGSPQFKLVLNSLVSTDKPFLQPNTAVPTTQVERLVFNETGVTVVDGEEHFSVKWAASDNCETLCHSPSDGLGEFIEDLILPYNYELDFSMCDAQEVKEVDLCKSHEELRCTLSRNKFNACEYWTTLAPYRKCQMEMFEIVEISDKFQAESLLSDIDKTPIIADLQSETYVGQNYKIPCIDS